jgi:hypothetical protein
MTHTARRLPHDASVAERLDAERQQVMRIDGNSPQFGQPASRSAVADASHPSSTHATALADAGACRRGSEHRQARSLGSLDSASIALSRAAENRALGR